MSNVRRARSVARFVWSTVKDVVPGRDAVLARARPQMISTRPRAIGGPSAGLGLGTHNPEGTWATSCDNTGVKSTDYSGLADQYAAHRRTHPAVLARLTAALDSASRVLELGCGTGNYATAIHGIVGCDCVGVDPSPQMLAKLQERSSSVRAIEGRAELLELPAGEFDLVYSVDVVHHVRDRNAAFREAFRVLAEGGRSCTVTDSEWMIRHREPQSVYFPETVDVEIARYPRIDVLREEMVRAGFDSLHEDVAEYAYVITDSVAYREKVFSSLLYISDEAFERGLNRLEADLAHGPIRCISRYLLLWGTKGPAQ
jgi:SAM-dependent methyltransferase